MARAHFVTWCCVSARFRRDHFVIWCCVSARFRRELEAGTVTGPVRLEVGELETTVRELEEKIALMENAGDQLAESMETAAVRE